MTLSSRLLKSIYRKEPITGFIIIVGAVDAVIGGVGEHWSLLTLGLMMVGIAFAMRWLQSQRESSKFAEQPVTRYLPSSPSRPPLPMLSTTRKPPHYD